MFCERNIALNARKSMRKILKINIKAEEIIIDTIMKFMQQGTVFCGFDSINNLIKILWLNFLKKKITLCLHLKEDYHKLANTMKAEYSSNYRNVVFSE